MIDIFDVAFCTEDRAIKLDVKTAWKIYDLLNSASWYLPDAAAYFMEQWGGEDDIDFVRAMTAKEVAKQCECYAGAIRGIICKEISPLAMQIKERRNDYAES